MIDAGHGGKDPGTVAAGGRVKEKEITLSVALKLGEMISNSYPHIEVIYTRKSDIYLMLDKRSEIANKSRADLFISIHVNGARSTAASGTESFVMGSDKSRSNLEVTMLENSVILLEGDDYKSRYNGFNPNDPESYIIFSLLQNAHMEQSLHFASFIQQELSKGPIIENRGVKQAPFLVLWKTGMPSVLVELGFITNQRDLKILNDKRAHTKFARQIFQAFQSYHSHYYKEEREMEKPPTPLSQEREIYTIQILSLSRSLPGNSKEFKGLGGIYLLKKDALHKFVVGKFSTLNEAKEQQREIRKQFPDAFIIKIKERQLQRLTN